MVSLSLFPPDIRRRGGKFTGAEILIAVGARRYVFFHSVGRLVYCFGERERLKQFCQKFAHNISFAQEKSYLKAIAVSGACDPFSVSLLLFLFYAYLLLCAHSGGGAYNLACMIIKTHARRGVLWFKQMYGGEIFPLRAILKQHFLDKILGFPG